MIRLLRSPIAVVLISILTTCCETVRGEARTDLLPEVQKKVVKIFGAGGLSRLKGYGTGFVVSPNGDIVTVWSHVLDSDRVDIVFWDGRRYEAELSGVDARRDLAMLRIIRNESGEDSQRTFSFFDLKDDVAQAEPGSRVLAVSNVFRVAIGDESLTVMRGIISAKTELEARRGRNEISFEGPVYLLDMITNNSGAAGGVVVTPRGRLVGVLGKELRNSRTNTWVNYAMPIQTLAPAIRQLQSGGSTNTEIEIESSARKSLKNPLAEEELGIITVPQVVVRTPAFIDGVLTNSSAAQSGLQPDDLILFLDDQIVSSCREWEELLAKHPRSEPVRIVIRRKGRLLTLELEAPVETK
ncbi:MAG: serine protease [Planctomycetaceae bacterium]|nr:serine protease [Planctomycetaceae bacterium]